METSQRFYISCLYYIVLFDQNLHKMNLENNTIRDLEEEQPGIMWSLTSGNKAPHPLQWTRTSRKHKGIPSFQKTIPRRCTLKSCWLTLINNKTHCSRCSINTVQVQASFCKNILHKLSSQVLCISSKSDWQCSHQPQSETWHNIQLVLAALYFLRGTEGLNK